MNILRLLLFEECNSNCEWCCNRGWTDRDGTIHKNVSHIPVCEDFTGYDQIVLTGGEPMLRPLLVVRIIEHIRKVAPSTLVYVYTAMVSNFSAALQVLLCSDGMTITLHSQKDVVPFMTFAKSIGQIAELSVHRSLRLNVFSGINLPDDISAYWHIKRDMSWIKNCRLPENEVLMRLKGE